MKNDTFESWSPGRSVVGWSLLGRSCFRAEVVSGQSISGPKYTLGQSFYWAEVFTGPKYLLGRSCFGPKYFRAEVSVGPKLSLGQTGCEPRKIPYNRLKSILKEYVVVFSHIFIFTKVKDWSEMKQTMLGVGHFATISGRFFDNYISSCHKTEDLTSYFEVPNLKTNLKWIKSYNIAHFFASSFLQFCKKTLKIYDS